VTLRARIAGAASVSVALAVLAAAGGLYLAVRSDLRGEVDRSLRLRAEVLVAPGPAPAPVPGGGRRAGGGGRPLGAGGAGSFGAGAAPGGDGGGPGGDGGGPGGGGGGPGGPGGFPGSVEPAPFGAASGYVQFISPRGAVTVPGGQGASPKIAPRALDLKIARAGGGRSLSDRTVNGTSLRVLTAGAGARGAIMIARPLTEVDRELSRLLTLLVAIGIGGIALAAILGALVARAALAPIARFTRRAETLTGSLDLSERLEVEGRDELARLAASFNASLDALQRSVEAQRHLIADASHELRTPIASVRANIQILEEAERLPPAEQEALRGDIIGELDELTALVADVVELARGAKPESAQDDVRLDALVQGALERARRRGAIDFQARLEPTLVRGQAARIDRAISNLLDNARKWSAPGAVVEVELADGVLSVRDHGPGFAAADLPFVFDRFYRADGARGLPGSGLGLAIVRQTAEAGGGHVQAENARGGGALLRVSFGAHTLLLHARRDGLSHSAHDD
jgi:two-component system sensor histidine kinase MprB